MHSLTAISAGNRPQHQRCDALRHPRLFGASVEIERQSWEFRNGKPSQLSTTPPRRDYAHSNSRETAMKRKRVQPKRHWLPRSLLSVAHIDSRVARTVATLRFPTKRGRGCVAYGIYRRGDGNAPGQELRDKAAREIRRQALTLRRQEYATARIEPTRPKSIRIGRNRFCEKSPICYHRAQLMRGSTRPDSDSYVGN